MAAPVLPNKLVALDISDRGHGSCSPRPDVSVLQDLPSSLPCSIHKISLAKRTHIMATHHTNLMLHRVQIRLERKGRKGRQGHTIKSLAPIPPPPGSQLPFKTQLAPPPAQFVSCQAGDIVLWRSSPWLGLGVSFTGPSLLAHSPATVQRAELTTLSRPLHQIQWNHSQGTMYGHRPTITPRYIELLEMLKNEYEGMYQEISMSKMHREDTELKSIPFNLGLLSFKPFPPSARSIN